MCGASIVAFDSAAMVRAEAAVPRLQSLSFVDSAYEACTAADALLVLTESAEFYHLDLSRIKKILRLPIVLDGKNVFNPLQVQAAGPDYYGIESTPARHRKPLAQASIILYRRAIGKATSDLACVPRNRACVAR
jgi:UDPglucose 6-dehydrogenase